MMRMNELLQECDDEIGGYKLKGQDQDWSFLLYYKYHQITLDKSDISFSIHSRFKNYISRVLGDKVKVVYDRGRKISCGPSVFNGVYQGTYEYSKAMNDLILRLYEKGVKEDPIFFSSYGYLTSDNSYFSTPLNLNLLDNSEYKKEIKLKEPGKIFKDKALELYKDLFSKMEFSSIAIRKKSHSGFPFLTYSEEKAMLVYYGIENLDKAIELFKNRNIQGMLESGLVNIFLQNERLTPQKHKVKIENNRIMIEEAEKFVVNPNYVKNQFLNYGKSFDGPVLSKMDFSIENPDLLGRKAGHGRVVYGQNISLNIHAQVLDGAIQKALKNYDACVMDSAENLMEKMKKKGCKYFVSWDYSSYDASNSGFMIDAMYKELENYVSKDFLFMIKSLRSSPILYYSIEKGLNNPVLMGRWFNSSMRGGESSGNGLVASNGKVPALAVGTTLMFIFQDSRYTIFEIANNEVDHFQLELMGDNGLAGFTTKVERDAFKAFLIKMADQHLVPFNLKVDEVASFIGSLWLDEATLMIDGAKFLTSILYTERGWESKPCFSLGFEEKFLRFVKVGNKWTDEIVSTVKEFLKNFGVDFYNMSATHPLKSSDIKLSKDLDSKILEIINQPDKLRYKYDIEDFDPDLVEQFFTTLDKSFIKEKYKNYINAA